MERREDSVRQVQVEAWLLGRIPASTCHSPPFLYDGGILFFTDNLCWLHEEAQAIRKAM